MARTPLILWCLLSLLYCCAPQVEAPPPTTLLVTNATSTACSAWIGGQPVADFLPRSRSLLRWMPPRPYQLRWACEALTGVLEIGESTETVILGTEEADAAPLADLTSSLSVSNPSAGDYSVRLDGAPLGNVLAGNEAVFHDLPAGTHQVTLLPSGSQNQVSVEVELRSQASARLEVPECKGAIHVLNDQPNAIRVELRDESQQVAPGEEHLWSNLPAGEHELTVSSNSASSAMVLKVHLECSETREVRLNRESSSLIIENRFDETLTLRMPGHEPVEVAAHQTHQLAALNPGTLACEARLASGRLLARELHLLAGQTVTWIVDAPMAELEITNLVGERIVILDGTTPLADLKAGASAILPVHPGPVSLSAWCPITEHTSPIKVDVAKGQRLPLRVGPQGGRIRLENITNEPMWAYRNGHFLGVIPPKVMVEFSGQPLGNNLVEITTSDGRLLARHKAAVGTVQTAVAATSVQGPLALSRQVIDVTVYNETGEAIKLDPTLGTDQEAVQPGVRLLVQVPVADAHVRAIGLATGLGYAVRVDPNPNATHEVHLQSQVAGAVVENHLERPVELWVDGKHVADLKSGEQAEVKGLSPDRHVLIAREAGSPEPLQQTAVILTPRGWFRWAIRSSVAATVVQNRSGETVQVEQGGAIAGRLHDSSQAKLPPASPEAPVTVKGEGSQQAVRVFLPSSGKEQTVSVGTNMGTLAVWGLSGRPCQVELDGQPLQAQQADAPEPMRLAAAPGERRILFRFEDGTVVERMVKVTPGIESAVRATPDAVALEVQNSTQETVSIWVADTQVTSLEPGQSAALSLPTDPAPPKVEAKAASGKRVWLLDNVALPGAGKFGWVLSE